jgi:hypothetical protein
MYDDNARERYEDARGALKTVFVCIDDRIARSG